MTLDRAALEALNQAELFHSGSPSNSFSSATEITSLAVTCALSLFVPLLMIVVTIVAAKDLISADLNGRSDPYVSL